MSDDDLEARLDAVERALTDEADLPVSEVRDRAALAAEVDRLDQRLADLEATVEELDAAVDAVRGYAGNVRAVNREVERRASAALAKAEALETAGHDRDDRPADAGSAGTRTRTENSGPGRTTDRAAGRHADAAGRDARADSERRSPAAPGDEYDHADCRDRRDGRGSQDPQDREGSADGVDGERTEQFIERVRDVL